MRQPILATLALLFAVALAPTMSRAADIVMLEETIETNGLIVQLTSSSTGRVLVRRCEECDLEPFILTRTSQLYAGGKLLKLSALEDFAKSGGTVMFKPDTNEITRIVIWGESE